MNSTNSGLRQEATWLHRGNNGFCSPFPFHSTLSIHPSQTSTPIPSPFPEVTPQHINMRHSLPPIYHPPASPSAPLSPQDKAEYPSVTPISQQPPSTHPSPPPPAKQRGDSKVFHQSINNLKVKLYTQEATKQLPLPHPPISESLTTLVPHPTTFDQLYQMPQPAG